MSRSAIESDYEFGVYDDDYRGFDIRDDESSRGPLILALALGILIVFGAVVWNTYRQGVRTTDGGLPIIAAAETPYKRTPEERGGTTTPDLGARIYDQIDGASRPTSQNVAAAAPAQQTLPQIAAGDTLQGGPAGADSTQADPIIIAGARKLDEVLGKVNRESDQQVASITPSLPSLPQPRVEPAVPLPAPTAIINASQFDFENNGDFLVQISALRTKEAAERAWTSATRKSPDLFNGGEKRIQRADLGAKGVFYRLRVGAFSERSAAAEFCSALKSAKHQCIVVQN